ncbi:MAG: zinc-binding dehydrogenase [Saprospiraceae bacterium]
MTKAHFLVKNADSNKAFELREHSVSKPSSDEVQIEVKSFGLNFADVLARRGLYQDCPPLPAVIGYDVAGFIKAVGSNVTEFTEGDRVVALSRFGGYSQVVNTMKEGVAKIPDELNFSKATALATQACTAYYCAYECVQLHKGDKILIQAAAGGVGTILVQMAKAKGCIIYGAASSAKQEYLRDLGVDYPIDYTKDNFAKLIKNHSGIGDGLDIVFDSLGGASFKKAFNLLSPGGKMVFIGSASSVKNGKGNILSTLKMAFGFGLYSPIQLILNSRSMSGVNMLRVADYRKDIFKHCIDTVVRLYEDGVIDPIIGKEFTSDHLAEAHEYLEKRKSVGKVAVSW